MRLRKFTSEGDNSTLISNKNLLIRIYFVACIIYKIIQFNESTGQDHSFSSGSESRTI